MTAPYKENALAITDEQVSANWRLGLLRAIAKVVVSHGLPKDSQERWGGATRGSNREHIKGRIGLRSCQLVEIYDITEDSGKKYYGDTYEEEGMPITKINAKATCVCGHLVKHPVEAMIPAGRFIVEVTTADPETKEEETSYDGEDWRE